MPNVASYWLRKVIVGARADAIEIAGRAEQVFGVVGADAEQDGLVHRAGEPKRGGGEACIGEGTIEGDAVGADQRNQNDIGPRRADAGEMRARDRPRRPERTLRRRHARRCRRYIS